LTTFTFKGKSGFMKNDYCLKHLLYFFCLLLILAQGCNTSDEKAVDIGLKYFPLKVGDAWTYNVSEVTYDTLIQNIVKDYQEQYEIVDTYKNQLNENVYVIHLSTRDNVDDDWEASQTWTAKVSKINEVIVSQEAIPFIKMILPVKEGVQWLGNKYNTIEADRNNGRIDTYSYLNVKKSYGDFANTITVQESNDLNLAYKDVRYSVYADSVGLIHRIDSYIDYCDAADCFGQYVRKHEHTKIQTLVEHVVQ
jgi:hypothetical protein